jgi:hypothetical protein
MSDNEFPMAFDTDGDGVADQYGFDTNGSGMVDSWAFDTNQDGWIDGVAQDTDGDGNADLWGNDLDQDGVVESGAADTTGDGYADTALASPPPAPETMVIGGNGSGFTIEGDAGLPSTMVIGGNGPGFTIEGDAGLPGTMVIGGAGANGAYADLFAAAENASTPEAQAQILGVINMLSNSQHVQNTIWLNDGVWVEHRSW